MKIQEQITDDKVAELLTVLKDQNFGNEDQRKYLIDILTTLHNSKHKVARKALRLIGDLFTEIGEELLDELKSINDELDESYKFESDYYKIGE